MFLLTVLEEIDYRLRARRPGILARQSTNRRAEPLIKSLGSKTVKRPREFFGGSCDLHIRRADALRHRRRNYRLAPCEILIHLERRRSQCDVVDYERNHGNVKQPEVVGKRVVFARANPEYIRAEKQKPTTFTEDSVL